jgi:hypothetical protein
MDRLGRAQTVTTNTQAMDAVHAGKQVQCTREEYVPETGIGIRGALVLYGMQRLEVGDIVHSTAAQAEVERLDSLLGFDPEASDESENTV